MTNEQIQKFLDESKTDNTVVQISFKTRNAIRGIFIKTNDYSELKSKNLWRIVTQLNIDNYYQSKDINLARIFNGVEFTRLSAV